MNTSLRSASEAILAAYPFAGGTPELVEGLLALCPELVLRDGDVLCRERSHGEEMYILLDGRVDVTKLDQRGATHLLTSLVAPDLIGQLALIDHAIRSATVVASGPAVVRVLDRRTYTRLCHSPTDEGATLRRLLLAALHQQLSRAHAAATRKPLPPRAGLVEIGETDLIEDEDTQDIEVALATGE